MKNDALALRIFIGRMNREEVMSMEKVKDLVCNAEIDLDESTLSYNLQGKTYHFCSEECRDDFSQQPRSYIQ